jgi:hypothetical protein
MTRKSGPVQRSAGRHRALNNFGKDKTTSEVNMKNLIARLFVIGTALAGAFCVNAADKSIAAYVPFNFYAGSTVMSQGAYRVDEVLKSCVVALKTMQTAKAITTHHLIGKSLEEPPRLVFRGYGDTYFLAEIWAGDGSSGHALKLSAREKEIAQGRPAPTLAVIKLAVR